MHGGHVFSRLSLHRDHKLWFLRAPDEEAYKAHVGMSSKLIINVIIKLLSIIYQWLVSFIAVNIMIIANFSFQLILQSVLDPSFFAPVFNMNTSLELDNEHDKYVVSIVK